MPMTSYLTSSGYSGHVQLSSGAPRVGLHALASRLHSLSGERRIPMTITALNLLLDTHRNNALMMLSLLASGSELTEGSATGLGNMRDFKIQDFQQDFRFHVEISA